MPDTKEKFQDENLLAKLNSPKHRFLSPQVMRYGNKLNPTME